MAKYKFILTYPNGETYDSFEEYGDDDFEGTFRTYKAAEDMALYTIGCSHLGASIENMMGDNDYDYDENQDISYEVVKIK